MKKPRNAPHTQIMAGIVSLSLAHYVTVSSKATMRKKSNIAGRTAISTQVKWEEFIKRSEDPYNVSVCFRKTCPGGFIDPGV